MFVFKAAVVGAGTMGGEIAHVIANADIPVLLMDADARAAHQGLDKARAIWQTQLDEGKLEAAELERKLNLITLATGYVDFGDVDFVIEAVPERMEIKRAVFSELDEATPGHAILASNTSSLSITEMGEVTGRPEQVVGFHFFFPASVARLIEVVEGEDTSEETAQTASTFAQALRKVPIRCAEVPGFVVNRVLNAAVSELWRFQEESGIDVKELDALIADPEAGRFGPFLVADLLGIDTVVHVAEHLNDCYGDRFYVHPGMRELMDQGSLGAKSGKGFYEHGS